MYDPCTSQGLDDTHEYLELYNYGTEEVNLLNWTLIDSGSDIERLAGFGNTTTILSPQGYAVITDEDSLVELPSTAIHLTTGDGSICTSGLSNAGETLRLFDQSGREVDMVEYSHDWGAGGNCKSLERREAEEEGESYNWGESLGPGGTPGERNSVDGEQSPSSTTTTTTMAVQYPPEACSDGTALGKCSKNRPYYCFDGILVLRCSKCGCKKGLCVDDECVSEPKNVSGKEKGDKKDAVFSTRGSTTSRPVESSMARRNPGIKTGYNEELDETIVSGNLSYPIPEKNEENPEEMGDFTGFSALSKAAQPKSVAAIGASAIAGFYILRKKQYHTHDASTDDL